MGHWGSARPRAAFGIVGTAVGAGLVVTLARRAWDRETMRNVADLDASPAPAAVPASLSALPAPVARYMEFALPPGQPLIRRVRITQRGAFRAGGPGAPWRPFSAMHHAATDPPGFVWDARIWMAPLLAVRVRDTYVRGSGAMRARVAGLIPVADQAGTPEMAAGALQRYLAEAPWYPTALLPGHCVTWEPIDDRTARATLADGETVVSLEFRFGERGEIASTYTPDRYRAVGRTAVPTPWGGRYGDYERVGGLMVPRKSEVEWILPDGPLPYFRARNVEIEFATSAAARSSMEPAAM